MNIDNSRALRSRARSLGILILTIVCAMSAGHMRLAQAGALWVAPQGASWININRDNLCVTEGEIEKTTSNRLSVDVPKMRAYLTEWTAEAVEIRFTYLGSTSHKSPLGSGQVRLQFGLKLLAQDPCNLVYAMWRIEPQSELVVSVKRNPSEHTSAECENRGYKDIKPTKASTVPKLKSGESHTLRAEMKNLELRVYVDNHEVWRGNVGADATGLKGPVGLRSDNVRLDFDLKAHELEGANPHTVLACKTGAANSD